MEVNMTIKGKTVFVKFDTDGDLIKNPALNI